MLKDIHGDRLFRKVKVRVHFNDQIFPERNMIQHTPARQGFNEDGILAMLEGVTNQLDTLYPFWEFKLQELAPEGRTARFLIDFAGYRAVPAPNKPTTESTTPAPDAAGLAQNEVMPAASDAGFQESGII